VKPPYATALVPPIPPLEPEWQARAAAHQSQLTMPTGALGRLLELGQRLCAIQQTLRPHAAPAAVVVLAADHGIAEENVSAYPQEVTRQMLRNFLQGGAAINVLCRRLGIHLFVADFGTKEPLEVESTPATSPDVHWLGDWAVARGTANFLKGPALTTAQALQALEAGRRLVREYLLPRGVRLVALGEMGIGNSTSASALTVALTGLPAGAVTGRGTGLDEAGWRHKVEVVARGIAQHFSPQDLPAPPLAALQAVGGLEIAGLVGVALEAAAQRLAVLLNGFISSVAGLLACRLAPALRDYLFATHRSPEAGHEAVLKVLALEPLLDLGLRLGEGSGAALAIPLLQVAADLMRDMATFASAGVCPRTS
jgi:nicotinate-nucleotide--dimethylbenzimidazole phosphoribosyltransferase